jgi:hypothetical protein
MQKNLESGHEEETDDLDGIVLSLQITKHLPARAEGYPWTLIYSSDQNGFSLKTLYRAMYDYDTPVLLVIKDTANSVSITLCYCGGQYTLLYVTQYHVMRRFAHLKKVRKREK